VKKKILLEEILLLSEVINNEYFLADYENENLPDIGDLDYLFNYLYKFNEVNKKKLVLDFVNKYRDLFAEDWYKFRNLHGIDPEVFNVIRYTVPEIIDRYRYYANINPKMYKFSQEEKFEQYIRDLSILIKKLKED